LQSSDEALFGFLVENSPDGVFILLDGQLVYMNQAAQLMFGVDLPKGASIPVTQVLDPSEHERAARNVALRISGVLRGATSYKGRRADGSVFPIEVHAVPLELRGRRGLHGIIRDITTRRVMEEQLEQLERSTVVTRLAAGIAHDFNNLLAVIQSNAEVAERSATDPGVQASVKRIHLAVQRGTEKVRQIQQMAKTVRDGDPHRAMYVNPIVEDVLELTRARWRDEAESLGIQYEVQWEPGLPPPVVGSRGDLQAALVAVVFNALESMEDGGTLTIRTGKDAAGEVLITVGDTGEGIPGLELSQLVDPFFTTRTDRQMGLGLQLVSGVLERHGGQLEIDSTPGTGTTVALLLPKADHGPTEPPPPPKTNLLLRSSSPSVPEPDRPRTRGGRSVLLIDDQADLVQVVRTILEIRGYSVDTALNGRDGVALAEATKYSIVLTDLGMPDISGWEVARCVREAQPGTPVILMTGWAAEIDDEKLAENQIQELLPKPFRSEQLLALMDRVLGEVD